MTRRAKSGTEGLSIADTWKGGVDNGRLRFLCRVRIPGTNRYKGCRFATREDAKAWGKPFLTALEAGLEVADEAKLEVIAKEYCQQLREGDGVKTAGETYIHRLEQIAAGLVRAGIRDMKAKTFQANVRTWVAGLKPNWWVVGALPAHCKTGAKPLSSATRNRIMQGVSCFCQYAMNTHRLMRHPLKGVKRFKEEKRGKATFTLDELAVIVSDGARCSLRQRRLAVEVAIAAAGGDIRRVRGGPLSQGICRSQRDIRTNRHDLGHPQARRIHHGGAF